MKARFALIALLAILVMALGACAAPTPQVVEKVVTQVVTQEKVVEKVSTQIVEKEKIVEKQVTVAPAATPVPAKKLVSWFQYDQGNVDPKADEKVGNEYLRKTIPIFNKEYEGKLNWENQYTPWEKIDGQTRRGRAWPRPRCPISSRSVVADVSSFNKNGAVQDLTEWAKAQKWYAEMDPSALKICTTPDGKLVLHPHGEPAFSGLRLEGPLPQRLPQDHGRDG